MIFTKCPIGCDSRLIQSEIQLPEGVMLLCPECGQLLSSVNEEAFIQASEMWDYTENVNLSLGIHKKRLKYILKHWKSPPEETRLIDIGCSFGMFLKVAIEHGFHVEGVETAKPAAEQSRKEGFTVHSGNIEDLMLKADSFDMVTSFEVIEHVKEPMVFLSECYRILRPGGLFVVSTPNTDSWTCKYLKNNWSTLVLEQAGHISMFNSYSLSLAALRTGFRKIKLYTRAVNLNRDHEKNRLKYRLLKTLSDSLVLPAKLLDKGDDVILFLTK